MTLSIALLLLAGLDVGQRMPSIDGEYLSGRKGRLPVESKVGARVALYALGFSYQSRFPVEAWVGRFEKDFGKRQGVVFFEIPVIGGIGMLGKPFINRGMRNGTPKEKHENVLTVYGGAGELRKAFGLKNDANAVLVLTDGNGSVRWSYEGTFEEARYAELKQAAEALLR
jgi:hypothetical protein